jgi:hypothetical protein
MIRSQNSTGKLIFLAMSDFATPREKRSLFAMTIERKTCSIQQLAKTANGSYQESQRD